MVAVNVTTADSPLPAGTMICVVTSRSPCAGQPVLERRSKRALERVGLHAPIRLLRVEF